MKHKLNSNGSSQKKVLATSIIFMGLSHILYLKQYIKGIFFVLIELCFIVFSPNIINKIIGLITLGEQQPDLSVKLRDNSIFMLIDGIIVVMLVILFIGIYIISIKSALDEYKDYCREGFIKKSKINDISTKTFPIIGLSPAVIMVVFFVVVPLIFSGCIAFTDYSLPDHIPPNNTVNWVGFDNFRALFGSDATWAGAFGRVALWTIIWAILATFTCFALGMFVAIILKERKIKITPIYRLIFILPYAVPSVISMLVWANLLNGSFGIVNRTLMELGWIKNIIPWLSNPTLAKATCVFVNLWAGFPYFMLLVMGTMTSISEDLFEAAKIDGATSYQTVKKITLPLVLYQTAPLLIMGFAHNINNFGAIYFLTAGNPVVSDTTITNAGGTDILVTWIYNLTTGALKYNYASVIAVIIFVVLAPFAIWNFRKTKSYKEGEI